MERRSRWILRSFLLALALAAGGAAASPWWTPWAVSFAGRWFDYSIDDWEKHSWKFVTYHGVVWERDNVRVTVDSLRVPAFVVWPEQHTGDRVRQLLASDVLVTVAAPERSEADINVPSQASTHNVIAGIVRAWPTLQKWLLPARIENLVVDAGNTVVTVDSVDWNGETVLAVGPLPDREIVAKVSLTVEGESRLKVRAEVLELNGSIEAEANVGETGTQVVVTGRWLENTATGRARFSQSGWIPETMTLTADDFAIAPQDYGIAEFETLTANVQVDWTGEDYVAAIKAEAVPSERWKELPPADVELRVSGDLDLVRIEAATITAPGLTGELSEPIALSIADRTPRGSAELRVQVDLAEFPWTEATGTVSGRVHVSGEASTEPEIEFDLSGEAIHWREAEIRSIRVTGLGRPSTVRVDELSVQFGDDSSAQGTAVIDLKQRQMEKVVFKIHATAEALRPWFPTLPEFHEVDASFKAAGALDGPAHSGELKWTSLEGIPGGALSGDFSWEGAGIERIAFRGTASSESGVSLPVDAAFRRGSDGTSVVELQQLRWTDAQGEWWKITQPARIDWTSTDDRPRIGVSGLQIRGEETSLDVDGWLEWPMRGNVSVQSSGFDVDRLAQIFPAAGIGIDIEKFELNAEWDKGPIALNGLTLFSYSPLENVSYEVKADFASDAETLSLGAISVRDESGDVLEGEGQLPLSLVADESGWHFQVPRDQALGLNLRSTPNPAFWESVAQITGWEVSEPKLNASLSGSIAEPRGRVEFSASRLDPPAVELDRESPFPSLEDVHLVFEADDLGLRVGDIRFSVEGNWITGKGLVPWPVVGTFRDERIFEWRKTEFRIASAPLPLSIAARIFPTHLSSDGQASVRMSHRPGKGFAGTFWLHNAALRPIAPLGPIRDIDGQASLEGYKIEVPQFVGHLGGRPIEISGTADISEPGQFAYGFHVESTRVPLVRRQGLVLRASMDVRVDKKNGEPAHVSGNVDFGQSFFVSDLTTILTTGSVASPENRPPYFSVGAEPLASWTLDVGLKGDDFMRVDTPFYKGTLSADVNLEGTLGEPRIVGQVASSSGRVIFPFGTMPLEVLEVSLTKDNPYDPVVIARGSTRVYGHDVRMDVSGTGSDPRLMFNSDPPLPSHEIFLMLTTGQMPRSADTFTTSERAQRLAMFIGQNLVRRFGIGGTTVEGEDRLIVRSGEEFSREGGETIHVQYHLDGRWSVVGEKDRFSAYNAGIQFRIINK